MAEESGVDDVNAVQLQPLTLHNAPALAALFTQRDVWRNFGYETAPSTFSLCLRLRQGDLTGVLFFRTSDARFVGFALGFGVTGPEAALEFAIAVPDPSLRRHAIAKTIGMRAVSWFFEQQLCERLWAWGDANNTAMLALVKTCGWEVVGQEAGGREMVDGHVETVEVRMTRVGWQAWRERETAG